MDIIWRALIATFIAIALWIGFELMRERQRGIVEMREKERRMLAEVAERLAFDMSDEALRLARDSSPDFAKALDDALDYAREEEALGIVKLANVRRNHE